MFKDYPLQECADAAVKLIDNGATIFQKWSCSHCGARQTMDTPNVFFTSGICEDCDSVTKIEACNYMLVQVL